MRVEIDGVCGRPVTADDLRYDLACVRTQLATTRGDSKWADLWRRTLAEKETDLLIRIAALTARRSA